MTRRNRQRNYAAWIAVGLGVLGSSAYAQGGDAPPSGVLAPRALPHAGLALQTTVEKIVRIAAPGVEPTTQLVPIAVPLPGDEVVYTVIFRNVSAASAQNIRITTPIPPTMRYLADTAAAPGSKVLYSVDGGRTYGTPSELLVANADGAAHAAAAADYTHVRWVLDAPLDAGARGFARFRAIVR